MKAALFLAHPLQPQNPNHVLPSEGVLLLPSYLIELIPIPAFVYLQPKIPLTGGGQIPTFVANSIAFLEGRGLHTLGLFRVSPSLKRVRQVRPSL